MHIRFINTVIQDNFDLIQKVDTPFAELENSICKPVTKKYTKTSDIVFINRKHFSISITVQKQLRTLRKIWNLEDI